MVDSVNVILTLICKVSRGAGVGAAKVERVEVQACSAGEAVTRRWANTPLTAFIAASTPTRRHVLIVSQRTVAYTGSTHIQMFKKSWIIEKYRIVD